MNDIEIKKLLSEIEADNSRELGLHKSAHIFTRAHEKRVCDAIYGESEAVNFAPCRRRIPLPLAVILIILALITIVGCGMLIYQSFRFIPNVGIVSGSDTVIYGTDEPITLKKLDVTGISYVENEGEGKLYIQINSKFYSHIGFLSVFADGRELELTVEEEWYRNNLRFYTASASVSLESYEITLSYKDYFNNEYRDSVTLKNMTDKSYKLLSDWPVVDGMMLKMLPADSANKIFKLDVNLPENTRLAVTDFNIYNDKGEVKGGFNPEGSSFYVCKGELYGSVTKIEINEVEISKYLGAEGDRNIPVPQDGEALGLDIPLISLDGYSDRLTEVRREGGYVYLTRKTDYAEGTLVTSCKATVRMPDDATAHMSAKYVSEDGREIVYKIWINPSAEEFTFRIQDYTYILNGSEPLGVIRIEG